MEIDLFPEKSQYLTNEPVKILAELSELPPEDCAAILKIYRLDQIIAIKKQTFTQKSIRFELDGFSESFAGFGAQLTLLQGKHEVQSAATAFDVVSEHRKAIRYGFLSDFGAQDSDCDDVENLRKYHINMVQFYDWSYRHDCLVAPTDRYTDMMGRSVSLNTVKSKIDACRRCGMKSLGYGAVYAASKAFFTEHPDWGLYTSADEPLVFIDIFYIMNVARSSPWHNHIIAEYAKAVLQLGFDGIHMDTYGFPKTAFAKSEKKNELIRLEEQYPDLIEDTKHALNAIKADNDLIFNNVGNWPVKSVARSPQDAVYIEVWEPYSHYSQIKQIIMDAKQACSYDKPVILAAYLAPFRTDTPERAKNAALLLTAAIASNGATHLLLGEKDGVLTQGYYVDHSFLSREQADSIRGYYDFLVRYMELLNDSTLRDVSFTHIGWDNTEYACVNQPWSADARPGTLWLTITENQKYKCIHLINLCGCENDEWNKGKETPSVQRDVRFRVQLDTAAEGIYFASPDVNHGEPQKLSHTIIKTDRGMAAEFSVPSVFCWSMVYIKLSERYIGQEDLQ